MKSRLLCMIILSLCVSTAPGATHTITNNGFTFDPSSLTVDTGDTVIFSISLSHNVREVNQTTWNSNGTTALPGGFSLPFGGGMLVLTTSGTHYYVCVPHAGLGMKGSITVNPITDVRPVDNLTPERFILKQNYPNPFNPSTTLEFSLPQSSVTDIAVFNVNGERVKTLAAEFLPPGTFTTSWNGTDGNGRDAGSGVYFVRMLASSGTIVFTSTRKILLVR